MQFLSSGLLAGLVLAGVPILIHLLNRRRFRLVEWAPMKYLKLTIKINRRRMRIEQFILLALRTLLMILIVFVIARPVLSSSGIGAWLAKRARVSRVIVLDDSLAMGYRAEGKTALARKQAVTEILRSTGQQDAVTVLTTTPAGSPIVREASLDFSESGQSADAARLITKIDALHPADAACNWAATFKLIDDCLSTATFPQKELIVVTDMRRSGWGSDVTALANRWAAMGVDARVIDVGSRSTSNISLARFIQEDPIALPGTTVKLTASIRNDTTAVVQGAQATLSVDGQSRPVMLPDLPAGATTDVPLSVVLSSPGQHALRLALPDDALPGDNTRFVNVNVRDKLDLLLVNGRGGSRAFDSAGDFLEVALTVGQDPWHVQRIEYGDVGDAPLSQGPRSPSADVAVLADVAGLSQAAVTEYEKRVRQGMGLMIFAGEQVDAQLYNDRLFRNGNGLLPMKLDRVLDTPVKGMVVEGFGDSPLAPLAKIAPAALAKIASRRFMNVEPSDKPAEGVRVLARWNDSENHPAVIEKRLGRGRVILWTTTADRIWTDWPVDPTYVLAVRSAAFAVAWPDAGDDNIVAGHPLEYRTDGARSRDPHDQTKQNPQVIRPEESTPQPLTVEGPALKYPHTERAGIYTLKWNDGTGKEQQHRLAASFDKSASDLEPITEGQLSQLLGNLRPQIVPYRSGQLAGAGPGREIWRILAMALLGLMFVESLLAFWVGRER